MKNGNFGIMRVICCVVSFFLLNYARKMCKQIRTSSYQRLEVDNCEMDK